jgi:two-component system response regulator PilR (NtrC family)
VTATVLLVDDEPDILQLLEITLTRMGIDSLCAATIEEARQALRTHEVSCCLTDMKLPDGNGLTLIEFCQKHYPEIPIAMITAHGSIETAILALKAGAFDFLTKPINLERLRDLVRHATRYHHRDQNTARNLLIGDSAPMQLLRDQINRVARSQAPVHLHGASGVGKEVVARAIHLLSPRAEQSFVAINCGAIPEELLESELFGHKKGAFTGAINDKPGLLLSAHGGTVLLDEVADLPLSAQVKLLRAIQEQCVRPVGAEREIPIDIRIISATHQNISAAVSEGRFRDDLYYRLNVIDIYVPRLKERPEDIPALTTHILARLSAGNRTTAISRAALDRLLTYDFPGNVRELENILSRAVALSDSDTLDTHDIQLQPLSDSQGAAAAASSVTGAEPESITDMLDVQGDLESHLAGIEKAILEQALQAHRWNKTATAKALGITFRSLRYRLKKLGLED